MPAVLGTIAPIGFDDFADPAWMRAMAALGCRVAQAYRRQDAGITPEAMQAYLAAGGLPCDSLHGVYGEAFDPSCPDEAARLAAVETYRSEGRLVRRLGGDLVVVHCSTIRRDGIDAAERAVRMAQLTRSIADLGAFGRETGVRYAFENLPAYHPLGSDVAELAALLRSTAAPNTGMCFDTGHAHMVGDVAKALRAAGDQVIYIHLSDNAASADEHKLPTEGTIPLDALADAIADIGYAGTIMLEVFHGLDRLRQAIDDGLGDRLARFVDRCAGQPA